MSADLHTHSTASDGRSTPTDLVAEAVAAGLDVIALTDHDTFAGVPQARAAAAAAGIRVVAGAEISTRTAGTAVHLLAYGDLSADGPLTDLLADTLTSRETRIHDMAVALAAGEGVDEATLLQRLAARTPAGATPGRPHLADALIDLGLVTHRDEAFARLLDSAGPYYVAYRAPSTAQAVTAVVAAGGVAVLAHPRSRGSGVLSDSRIADLQALGLAGLEVDHRDHDDVSRFGLRALAADLGLLITGSSDYHGTGKLNRLGENTTAPEVVEAIEARLTRPW